MTRRRSMVVAASLLVLAARSDAGASASRCAAGKLACVAQNTACLLAVEAEARADGRAPDATKLARCRARFDGGANPSAGCFAKVEAKNACATNGDVGVHESNVDAFVADVVASLDPNPAADPNRCTAGKLRCVRDKAKCMLAARRAALQNGSPVEDRLARCRLRFDGGATPSRGCFARRERSTSCLTSGDVGALEARVDAFEHDTACRLGAATNCPTPTPTVAATPTLTATPTLPCVACACPPPATPATPVPTCTPAAGNPFGCPIPTPSPPPCGSGFGPPSCGINACPFREVCTQSAGACECAPCCPCP
jgi:hypothetical protein